MAILLNTFVKTGRLQIWGAILACSLALLFFFSFGSSVSQQRLFPTEPNWMDRVIEQDFSPFRDGITEKMVETTWKKVSSNPDFKRYQIINSQVYGPNTPLLRLLKAMGEKYPLPDVDFIYYHQDFIKESFFSPSKNSPRAPVFASAKRNYDERTVLFVDWFYDIENQKEGWNSLIRNINLNQSEWPWEKRKEILFWRGSSTDGYYTWENWTNFPRGRLVYESQFRHSPYIDAGFTGMAFDCITDCPLEMLSFVPPEKQIQYKYHIDLDGVTSTFPALQWKLLTGSLVFKQTSDNVMWFHSELIPFQHFIPVHNDLRDLNEKIAWAREHDLEAKQIAFNGREFALTHLMPEQILLYCYKSLCKYASLQKFQPKRR